MGDESLLLKRVYGELSDPLAQDWMLAADIPFSTRDKLGEFYIVPVRLGLEQGITVSKTHTSINLNNAIPGVYEQAQVAGSEIINRAELSYGNMARLAKAKGNSKEAYDQDVALKIVNMVQGAEAHREIHMLYGAGPGSTAVGNLGVVGRKVHTAGQPTIAIAFTTASLMPGFWQDMLGMRVQFLNAAGTGHPANVGTQSFQVTSIGSIATLGYLTLTEVDAGAADDLATDIAGVDPVATNALQIIPFGSYQQSMVGITGILSNGASTLFNISGATYPQWRGVTIPVGGAFSFNQFIKGIARAATNKLKTGGTLYIGHSAWSDLISNEVAMREYFGKDMGGVTDVGFSELVFTTQVGKTKIRPYPYLKQGDAVFLANKEWGRYGSTDLTNTLPGNPDEWFFHQQTGRSGAEIRTYGDMCVFCENPSHSILYSGIASSSDINTAAVTPVVGA